MLESCCLLLIFLSACLRYSLHLTQPANIWEFQQLRVNGPNPRHHVEGEGDVVNQRASEIPLE